MKAESVSKEIDPKFCGTYTGYVYGCRCDACRAANYRQSKQGALNRAIGKRRVSIDVAREIIDRYLSMGYKPVDIGIASGLGLESINSIRLKKHRKYVNYPTFNALASARLICPRMIPSEYCLKIEQSLEAIGWTQDLINKEVGNVNCKNSRGSWHAKPMVSRKTAINLLKAYLKLSKSAGPSEITRKRAIRKGYKDPFDFDEELRSDPITVDIIRFVQALKNVA